MARLHRCYGIRNWLAACFICIIHQRSLHRCSQRIHWVDNTGSFVYGDDDKRSCFAAVGMQSGTNIPYDCEASVCHVSVAYACNCNSAQWGPCHTGTSAIEFCSMCHCVNDHCSFCGICYVCLCRQRIFTTLLQRISFEKTRSNLKKTPDGK